MGKLPERTISISPLLSSHSVPPAYSVLLSLLVWPLQEEKTSLIFYFHNATRNAGIACGDVIHLSENCSDGGKKLKVM